MRDPTSKQSTRTPRHIFSDEDFARYRRIFDTGEDDPNQQEANEAISGPGRSHFHPADRPTRPYPIITRPLVPKETQSIYYPHEDEPILPACRSAIDAHQTKYRIDPLQIRISSIMYFDLSEAMRKRYCTPFTGKLSFIGISNIACYADVRVYSDISTNVIICIH